MEHNSAFLRLTKLYKDTSDMMGFKIETSTENIQSDAERHWQKWLKSVPTAREAEDKSFC